MGNFKQSVFALIQKTSTILPDDVLRVLYAAKQNEVSESRAALVFDAIGVNLQQAKKNNGPICQDTGLPTFKVYCPVGVNQLEMEAEIQAAVEEATKVGLLRPNAVDSLTGENSGNNLGVGLPVVKFKQWGKNEIQVSLILKGGGCENKNAQYSLPTEIPGLGRAGRDLEGIKKCILHAVYDAQGQGCSPGFIGVGIGGDRAVSYDLAKEQLFRFVDDVNPDEKLAVLEQEILQVANEYQIGPMGFGGRTTLLGCKIGAMHRLPASFFVSVAYNCWAYRRHAVILDVNTMDIQEWVYDQDNNQVDMDAAAAISLSKHIITLQAPLTEEKVRSLKVGDVVQINGRMLTGRDAIHKFLYENDVDVNLNGQIVYHCGPVMLKDANGVWHVKAAGPTTSIREEPYQGAVMKKYGIRAIMGKGGMGSNTLSALAEHGGVYLNAIGGCAQFYSDTIKNVAGVNYLEFGIPEAMWDLNVEGFLAVVTMDAHGNSLHQEIADASFAKMTQKL
ncbi:MAG: fumarate hydratase [Bacillales bacterium]|nr:fumarate hydratase [Bacillales bacterium]